MVATRFSTDTRGFGSTATHAARLEFGDVGGPEDSYSRGLLVHTTLLMDAETEEVLGPVDQHRWTRPAAGRGRSRQRDKRPYEDKESFKWQRACEKVSERLGDTMQRVITVCDREADVYEYLLHKSGRHEGFVVRSSWSRRVLDVKGGLNRAKEELTEVGRVSVTVPQRGGKHARRKRTAMLTLRAGRVTLLPPKKRGGLPPIEVGVLLCREEQAPEGAEALSWTLFTSEDIDDATTSEEVMRYYQKRWTIEEFHKVWKSGCRIEKRPLQSAENLQRMIVITMFVAVRLLGIRERLDVDPEASCDAVLEHDEWRVLWLTRHPRKRLPTAPPSVAWAYDAIARLGGFLDTKRTGRAGWQTLWKGWDELTSRVEGFRVAMRMREAGQL